MKKLLKDKFIILLIGYACIVMLVIIIESFDQLCPGVLPFPFNFWEALIAVGTIGTVIAALILPIVKKKVESEERRNQIISNIHNEVFINLDQLSYNSLNRRDFTLEIRQFDLLLNQSYQINIEAEGIFRKLRIFYRSAKWFNERMDIFVREYNKWIGDDSNKTIEEGKKKETWLKIKRDAVKHMLLIFWLGGLLDFEKEGEVYMKAINDFLSIEKLDVKSFDKLKDELIKGNFWKLDEFTEIIKQLSDKHINFEQLRQLLLENEGIDITGKKEIVLNYLIHRLAQANNQLKDKMRKNLKNELKQLVRIVEVRD